MADGGWWTYFDDGPVEFRMRDVGLRVLLQKLDEDVDEWVDVGVFKDRADAKEGATVA